MIKIVRLYLSFFEATLRLQKWHILMNGWNRLPVMVAATYSLKAFYFPGQSVFDCISSLFPPAPIIYSHESGRASEARQGETGGRGFALWHSALVFQKGTMQSPLQSLRRGGRGAHHWKADCVIWLHRRSPQVRGPTPMGTCRWCRSATSLGTSTRRTPPPSSVTCPACCTSSAAATP